MITFIGIDYARDDDWSTEVFFRYDDRGTRHLAAVYRWRKELDLVPNKANEKAGTDAGIRTVGKPSDPAKTSA